MRDYSPSCFTDAPVARYGCQNPRRTRGNVYKYLHGDTYVNIIGLRFANVSLVSSASGEDFSQEGDSGGPVAVAVDLTNGSKWACSGPLSGWE